MDNRNTTIYVRIKGKRPVDFVDPKPFEWDEDKDQQLWKFISKLDNSIDQIDWTKLSIILNVPIFFLRERSYKLFENHMSLMKRKFNIKKLNSLDSTGNVEAFKNSSIIKNSKMEVPTAINPLMESSIDKSVSIESTGSEKDDYTKSTEKLDQTILSKNSAIEVLSQLHVSKVLGRTLDSTENKKLDKLKEVSDDDTSSSLSVSKSALEEALLERLHF